MSFVFKVVVYLARTNDNSLDLRAWDKICFLVRQDSFESITFLELLDVRACSFEFEKLLWSYYNQRFAEWSSALASEHMEVLGGSRTIDDLHVDSLSNLASIHMIWRVFVWGVCKLQISFDSA